MYREDEIPRRSVRRRMSENHTNGFWGAVVVGIISAVGSRQQQIAAEKAARRGRGLSAAGEKSLAELMVTAEEWDERYDELYAPIEKGLAEDVAAGPDYEEVGGQAATDVTLSYDKQRQAEERRFQRYGIDPSSGRSAEDVGRDKARTEVMAKNVAYGREEDKDWARKMAFTQMGRRLESGAADIRAGAASGFRSFAGLSAAQSTESAASASRLAGATGKFIGQAVDQYRAPSSEYTSGYGIDDTNDQSAWAGDFGGEQTAYGEDIWADA